ncbi:MULTISPECIES: NADPH-dependent FMN reductase [Streptomyces]|uniref:NADPH-dependent FMN reductase n=1 Tax=Streptomyces ochraceiscleroticus TaxID=47761 RepID=A0ABW1MYU2_9ACTN|nr:MULTISPECIES: NAD(P)H-dependent oxidoreductase [Streptomyces]
MSTAPLKLAVVIGSVRENRLGAKVGDWFVRQATQHPDVEVDVIDVIDHPLPLAIPGFGQELDAATQQIKDGITPRIEAADAFVVITPEYNHSFPASLKNAIDWHLSEWAAKPVGLVSYGGMGGGLRAAEHLRQVFAEVHAMTIREMISFHNPWGAFEDGAAPEGADGAAKKLLDQLSWWGRALRTARAETPYQA